MSAIALVVDPSDPRPHVSSVRRMLAVVPHRLREGLVLASTPHVALGTGGGTIVVDRDRQLAVVADARLEDRSDLLRALDLEARAFGTGEDRAGRSDADLIAEAYARWGTDAAAHLLGHFAFVVWDGRARKVYAARDAFGHRPLFWTRWGSCAAFATEVESLATSGAPLDVDDGVVLEHLLLEFRLRERTFLAGVHRVSPGHQLVIDGDRVRHERWFEPPKRALPRSPREVQVLLREELLRAVERSLERERPVLAELSGGIDSSSIVCAAALLRPRPSLTTLSAIYPGLPCDEARFIDVVTRHTRFPSERFDGTTSAFGDYAVPDLLHPGPSPTSGLAGERAVVAKTGARAVLSGAGGDQLFFERGLFRDLAAAGRWPALLREAWLAPRYSTRKPKELLRDAISGLAPKAVRDARRRLERPRALPDWLGPRLRPLAFERAHEAPEELELGRFASSTQAFAWRWLTSPATAWLVEIQELKAARLGVSMRFPFLDARLVSLVLSIPWQDRLPHGRMKALLRDSMQGVLPPEIRERRHITSFESAVRAHVLQHRSSLEAVLSEGTWCSEPYVERDVVVRAVASLSTKDVADWRGISFAWSAVMLELWLRRLARIGQR